jgi:para-nitrobenzyl esterase
MIGLKTWASLLGAALVLAGAQAARADQAGPVVQTTSGAVRGVAEKNDQVFMGLPYAAPPIGPLRWKPPAPAPVWTDVRDASKPSSACAQTVSPGMANPANSFGEDCLYLNVTVPTTHARSGPLPVMVWVHGGGFSNGTGEDYDGRRLAATGDVIVVTINYRLGVFGFFGMPGLDDSGVFGLQDQQAALKWVRRNAAAFGGDPRNVTLFGESAGAMSACAQLTSPTARGLFDKVILESGSCLQSWSPGMIYPGVPAYNEFLPLSELYSSGSGFAAKMGCKGPDAIDCLRKLPTADLVKAWSDSRPAYGGQVLPREPARALRDGDVIHVPLIWGSNRDEWRPSAGVYAMTKPFTVEVYESFLKDAFGDRAKAAEALYSASALGSPAYAWAAVSTDTAWSCPTLTSDRLASRYAPVYAYEFADRHAPNPAFTVGAGFDIGAAHATELAYLFDLTGKHAAFSPEQERLSTTMMRYWTNFAATGDPNGPGLPDWPKFDGADGVRELVLRPGPDGIAPGDMAAEHHCDFWSAR